MANRDMLTYQTAAFDCETDPFMVGRFPQPFACGLSRVVDGKMVHHQTWGEDCVREMMAHIAACPDPLVIYAHNGGRFDFHFLFDWVESPIFIIQSRLVEFVTRRNRSARRSRLSPLRHVWRDSFAIIPVGLADYAKDKIDYKIMEPARRDLPNNRKLIATYLQSDCENLLKICMEFRQEFEGQEPKSKHKLPLTIGQASMRQLRNFHEFDRATHATDAAMRPFYHGGRVQCFQGGILPGPWQVYDVNSSYPAAMKNYQHPLTDDWQELDKPPRANTPVWFAEITARNHNALPMRTDTGTRFDIAEGRFFACSHELVPAMEAGLIEVLQWHRIYKPRGWGKFDEFVDYWNTRKIKADRTGDKGGRLFAKLILNSAYGKFGQDPSRYASWEILRDPLEDRPLREKGYEPALLINPDPTHWLELWQAPAPEAAASFNNVGIAASITSASRAILMAGIQAATDPVYCDTDSLICRGYAGEVHPTRLGAWKAELPAPAQFLALAGRKTYALYDPPAPGHRLPVVKKLASKGGDLTASDIIRLCRGGEVEQTNKVPLFSVKSAPRFTTRRFRKTVDERGKPLILS